MRMSIVSGHQYGNRVQLRYNYRLYPDGPQCEALARVFGCARVVFNDALAARRAAHAAKEPYITDAALSAALTASKQTPERAWLGEVSSAVLQQALADLNTAYGNFFGVDRRQAVRRPVLRVVRGRDQPGAAARNDKGMRDRPWPDSLRRAGRRHQDRRAEVPAARGEKT